VAGLAAPASAEATLAGTFDFSAACSGAPTPMKVVLSNTGPDSGRAHLVVWNGGSAPDLDYVFTVSAGGSQSVSVGFIGPGGHLFAWDEDTGVTFFDRTMTQDCRPPALIGATMINNPCDVSIQLSVLNGRQTKPNPVTIIAYTSASSTPIYEGTVTPLYPGYFHTAIPFRLNTGYEIFVYEHTGGTTILHTIHRTTCV